MPRLVDISLLIQRLALGGFMAVAHGWPKFGKLTSGDEIRFPDPLGIGVELSLTMATLTELVCAVLLMLGLASRLNAVALAFTMAVAGFLQHGGDPFADRELALLYLAGYVALAISGTGKLAISELITKGQRSTLWQKLLT